MGTVGQFGGVEEIVGADDMVTDDYSVTGTVDHALTDNLTAKVEIRWDHSGADSLTGKDGSMDNSDAVGALLQFIYAF